MHVAASNGAFANKYPPSVESKDPPPTVTNADRNLDTGMAMNGMAGFIGQLRVFFQVVRKFFCNNVLKPCI